MSISAQDVKKLRDKTGAGFTDCKKALEEADGNFEKAEKILKEMGLAQAEKRSSREANEGRVFTYISDTKAGIMELSCETDFVSRNEIFVNTGEDILKKIITNNLDENSKEVLEEIGTLGAKCKENVSLKKLYLTTIGPNEYVHSYIHGDSGKIGVIIKVFVSPKLTAEVSALIKDLALHLAFYKPIYMRKEEVAQNYIEEQKVIFEKQIKESGKEGEILKKMLEGKVNKHMQEICFLSQPFIKDEKISIEKVIEASAKEMSLDIKVIEYKIFQIA